MTSETNDLRGLLPMDEVTSDPFHVLYGTVFGRFLVCSRSSRYDGWHVDFSDVINDSSYREWQVVIPCGTREQGIAMCREYYRSRIRELFGGPRTIPPGVYFDGRGFVTNRANRLSCNFEHEWRDHRDRFPKCEIIPQQLRIKETV